MLMAFIGVMLGSIAGAVGLPTLSEIFVGPTFCILPLCLLPCVPVGAFFGAIVGGFGGAISATVVDVGGGAGSGLGSMLSSCLTALF